MISKAHFHLVRYVRIISPKCGSAQYENKVVKCEQEIVQMGGKQKRQNWYNALMKYSICHYSLSMMCDSEVTRSIAIGDLTACPWENLAPLIAWMDERRRK